MYVKIEIDEPHCEKPIPFSISLLDNNSKLHGSDIIGSCSTTDDTKENESNIQTIEIKNENRSKKSSDLDRLECDMCGKKMFKRHRMLAHLREHLGLKPFHCDECDVSYRKWGTLKSHNDIHHSASGKFEKFQCDFKGCTRSYNLKNSLLIHKRRTHEGQPIRRGPRPMCDTCGKTFRTNFCLTVSELTGVFSRIKLLLIQHFRHQEHMYIHKGVDSYPFSCEICNKRFLSKYQMKIHIMRHNNIRNHACPLCGKRTTTAKEMRIHIAYHEKSIPYPCETCGRVFQSKGNRSHF